MRELPFGYKMDDEVCKLLMYWEDSEKQKLKDNGLIYNRHIGTSWEQFSWKLSDKGGKLYNAIIDNLKLQYLYGKE